jgi:mono/diheme cytochrome c family protein
MNKLTLVVLIAGTVLLAGCRGMISEKPPVHPNLNMDFQEKFEPQEANPFFADGRAMRPPVPGTVARGLLKEDTPFYLGRTAGGEYIEEMPVPMTRELLLRGRERYNIFCTVCHGGAGDGQGIIMTGQSSTTGQGYGYTPAPSYHIDRLRQVSDGYMYDVIANGVRNMPGYAQQISVLDRWAIVAYVRALQLSQNAGEGDVPPSELAKIAQGASANMEGGRTGTTGGGSSE